MHWKEALITTFLITCWTAGIEGGKAKGHDHDWGYSGKMGPENWDDDYPTCGGNRQSPIDIDVDQVKKDENLKLIKFFGYETHIKDAILENNGHTAQLTLKNPVQSISGGGLNGTYKFLQLHFHWGQKNDEGSEHTIEGSDYPLEMHLVHYNSRYKPEVAIMKPDGLAVLGVLFELSKEDNKELASVIDTLDDIIPEGSSAEVKESFDLDDLLPDDTLPYYRYEGSLTTPPCYESVIWTVFKHTQTISERQLEQFRALKEKSDGDDDDQLEDNFRPTQKLHGRVVKISSDTGDEPDKDEDEGHDHDDDDDDNDDDDDDDDKNAASQIIPSLLFVLTTAFEAYNAIF
ncbi:carbonic anhydrase-like [Centruroides vittatus]|uniref:carbonic anhydrase-like n=1 Tax=Centruroides vittatus TaxID=120091 RepID=UPI00351086E7